MVPFKNIQYITLGPFLDIQFITPRPFQNISDLSRLLGPIPSLLQGTGAVVGGSTGAVTTVPVVTTPVVTTPVVTTPTVEGLNILQ